jgi:hypothetical protein
MTNAVNIAQSGSNNVTFRNRIINGAMVINQRNTAVSTSDTYTVDRWQLVRSSDATESVAQNTDAPAGFTYSLRDTISVGDASIAATQFSGFKQPIEGYNIADLGFGTANAQNVTVSFWVRSSVTGQYTGNIANSGYTRMCPFNFTINTANTWEQKTNTFPGDTSGTWLTTNGIGMNLQIYSALGSTYASGTANTWGSSGSNFGCGSPVNGIASNGNIFAITGVQLEAGTTASPFEYRQYGTELALCQRYYNMVANYSQTGGVAPITNIVFPSATDIRAIYNFPVQMRVAPSVVSSSGSLYFRIYNGNNIYANSISLDFASVSGIGIVSGGGTSGATQGQGGIIFASTAGAYFALSAEL